MTGLDGHRVYLDWNASAPLRPEARAAMREAMDTVGNPSSVHAEGRAARAIVEKARGQVAMLVGCDPSEVVFTSGATEATALAMAHYDACHAAAVEHDCVWEWVWSGTRLFSVSRSGEAGVSVQMQRTDFSHDFPVLVAPTASSETGVRSPLREHLSIMREKVSGGGHIFADLVSLVGRIPIDSFHGLYDFGSISGHKLGGARGVGALIERYGVAITSWMKGGGQEQGRRSGTENVIGIAGFGAAAEAARRDLEAGVWERVARLRDDMEGRLKEAAPDLILFGEEAPRLPNTSCFAVPGWAGETQVMQMDLAGFAVSAGSACSSGKVQKASRVLMAMGYDEVTASSAIRVSTGPTTTEAEVMAFADAWIDAYRRRKARAA